MNQIFIDSGKSIKIVLYGNSQVGKTAIINEIKRQSEYSVDKLKNQSEDNLQRNILGSVYHISITKHRKSKIEKSQNTDSFQIGVIVFDILNEQSFKDAISTWLKLVQSVQSLDPKTIVLVANKIDKNPQVSLERVYDFVKSTNIGLFYNTTKKEQRCTLLEEIIMWHEFNCELKNSKSSSQTKKNGTGFASMILGLSRNKVVQEEQRQKSGRSQLLVRLEKKIYTLRKALFQDRVDIDNHLIGLSRLSRQLCEKYQIGNKAYKGLIALRDNLSTLEKQKSEFEQKKLMRINTKLQSTISINELEIKLKREKQQLAERKILMKNLSEKFNLFREQERPDEQKLKIQLDQCTRIYESKIIEMSNLEKAVSKLEEEVTTEVENDQLQIRLNEQQEIELLKKNSDLNAEVYGLTSFLSQNQVQDLFFQLKSLSEVPKKHLEQIKKHIQGFSKRSVKKISKVYDYNFCKHKQINDYLLNKKNLLYSIQTDEITMIFFIAGKFTRHQPSNQGLFFVYNKNYNILEQLTIDEEAENIRRYYAFGLQFGGIFIQVSAGSCEMRVEQSPRLQIFNRGDYKLCDYLGITPKEQNQTYQILCLEVSEVTLKS